VNSVAIGMARKPESIAYPKAKCIIVAKMNTRDMHPEGMALIFSAD
jgi:hypothetical protein